MTQPDDADDPRSDTPPPLVAAASLVAVQGAVLLLLAVLEGASISSDRRELGISTTVFFAAYGVVLLVGAFALWRRAAWARGPVLLTQLIGLGLAWSLREHVAVAIALAVVATITLAGILHPDTIAALERDQSSDSSD